MLVKTKSSPLYSHKNMNLTNVSKSFLSLILKHMVPVLSKFDPRLQRLTPPSVEDVDIEAAAQPDGGDVVDPQLLQAPGLVVELEHRKKDLNNAMVAFCFASSMAIALLPVQVYSQLQSSLPFLALALLLGFTSFFLSVFINSKFVVTLRVLQKVGQIFTVTAFFMAITLRFPFYFKCTSWAIYLISFLSILISSCF